jgi:hypothetical protein
MGSTSKPKTIIQLLKELVRIKYYGSINVKLEHGKVKQVILQESVDIKEV